MRIAQVDLTNILGIKSISFRPATLTIIKGRNGSGKSSIIDGIRQAFDGGSDPGLLHRGARFGEAVLTLDDGRKIKMRVTATKTNYEVENPDGSVMPAARSFIQTLADSLSVDPARLVNAKPKELAAILLEVMPIRFTKNELEAAINPNTWPIARDMSLEEIEGLRKQIYETRTTSNRQADQAKKTITSLQAGLPADEGVFDYAARSKELRNLLDEAKRAREADIATINRQELDAIAAIQKRAQKEIDEQKALASAARSQKDKDYEPDLLKISAAAGEAEQRMRDSDRAEGIRTSLAEQNRSLNQAVECSQHFSEAIEGLDKLKLQKLSSLPIPGLRVQDGITYYNDVPFEHVNLRTRIELAFQICALRSNGTLPFMLLDEAEAFDPQSWEDFKAGALESGYQIIAGLVSDGPLTINPITQPELATA